MQVQMYGLRELPGCFCFTHMRGSGIISWLIRVHWLY